MRPYVDTVAAKEHALRALDQLLGSHGDGTRGNKIAAMRDVAAAANRMLRNLEQWRDDEARRSS